MEYGNLIGLNDLELNISVFKVINTIYYFFFYILLISPGVCQELP